MSLYGFHSTWSQIPKIYNKPVLCNDPSSSKIKRKESSTPSGANTIMTKYENVLVAKR